MTPGEARETLLERGFHSKWIGRRLVGGSHYRPGNPGVFEGASFVITLVAPDACEVEWSLEVGETRKIEPDASLRDRADGVDRSLDWAVGAVLKELWGWLDRDEGKSPKVPLEAVLEAARACPNATTEVGLLSEVIYMGEERRKEYEAVVALYPPAEPRVGPTAEEMIAEDLTTRLETPPWAPPATVSQSRPAKPAVGPTISYGALDRERTPPKRDFHWARLEGCAVTTEPIAPFYHLDAPHEMSLTLFMSALRQTLELAEEGLCLVVLTSEPNEGKVTARFLGTKDAPATEKPAWLLERAVPAERAHWMSPA